MLIVLFNTDNFLNSFRGQLHQVKQIMNIFLEALPEINQEWEYTTMMIWGWKMIWTINYKGHTWEMMKWVRVSSYL